jgi:hemolysin activation/secretion protein
VRVHPRGLLIALFLIYDARGVYAQSIPLEVQREAQRIQDREIDRQNALERRLFQSQSPIKDFTPAEIDEDNPSESATCESVTEINIKGMTRFHADQFKVVREAAVGACIYPTTLRAVERAITNAYVKRGFITSRAFAVRDTRQPNVVYVRVVEGKIASVQSQGVQTQGQKPRRAYEDDEIGFAFGDLDQHPLNLRRLEQGVDQLARLPSGTPQIDIVPAAEAGKSDIMIRRERLSAWLRPSVTLNNSGSKSTGKETIILSLDADSPFGVSDFFSGYLSQDIAHGTRKNSTGGGLFFTVPAGRLSFSASGNIQSYRSILTSNDLQFSNEGRTFSGFFAVDSLIFRNARHKLAASLQVALFDTATRIQDIRLATNSYRLATVSLRGTLQSRIGNGHVVTDIAYVRGLSILGAKAADFGPAGPRINFDKIEAGFALQFPTKLDWLPFYYATNVRGQWSFARVLPSERFNIGGDSTVRGYRDDGASGDHGITARTQLTFPLIKTFTDKKTGAATQFSLLLGHDAGWVWTVKDASSLTFIQSMSAGLSIANRRVSGLLTVSQPISRPQFFQPRRLELLTSLRLTI